MLIPNIKLKFKKKQNFDIKKSDLLMDDEGGLFSVIGLLAIHQRH
jgi:hypothetical protein